MPSLSGFLNRLPFLQAGHTKIILANDHAMAFHDGFPVTPGHSLIIPKRHIHLIPRYTGDTDDPRGGVRWIMPEKAPYWKKK